jgi:hypothetical protein
MIMETVNFVYLPDRDSKRVRAALNCKDSKMHFIVVQVNDFRRLKVHGPRILKKYITRGCSKRVAEAQLKNPLVSILTVGKVVQVDDFEFSIKRALCNITVSPTVLSRETEFEIPLSTQILRSIE